MPDERWYNILSCIKKLIQGMSDEIWVLYSELYQRLREDDDTKEDTKEEYKKKKMWRRSLQWWHQIDDGICIN